MKATTKATNEYIKVLSDARAVADRRGYAKADWSFCNSLMDHLQDLKKEMSALRKENRRLRKEEKGGS
jgi:hypothetical protein